MLLMPHIRGDEIDSGRPANWHVLAQASDLAEQGHTMRGVSWQLTVPYRDFAGQQLSVVHLETVCRGDTVDRPWLIEHVVQAAPAHSALAASEATEPNAERGRWHRFLYGPDATS